mgnify:CR=1 FL=1
MDDIKLALLGDKAAQERLTERGELVPCAHCKGNGSGGCTNKKCRYRDPDISHFEVRFETREAPKDADTNY